VDKNVDTSSPEVLVNNARHEAAAALSALDDGVMARVAYHVERLEAIIDELEEEGLGLNIDGPLVVAFKRGVAWGRTTNAPLPNNGEIAEKLVR
jgi:hypothetical protein